MGRVLQPERHAVAILAPFKTCRGAEPRPVSCAVAEVDSQRWTVAPRRGGATAYTEIRLSFNLADKANANASQSHGRSCPPFNKTRPSPEPRWLHHSVQNGRIPRIYVTTEGRQSSQEVIRFAFSFFLSRVYEKFTLLVCKRPFLSK